jgi:cryptochrome 1
MCLSQRLQDLGSRLVVRRARESVAALQQLVAESGAQAVFFNHLYDSISMVRDQQVKDALRGAGVAVSTFNADLLYEPWEVLDEAKQVRFVCWLLLLRGVVCWLMRSTRPCRGTPCA